MDTTPSPPDTTTPGHGGDRSLPLLAHGHLDPRRPLALVRLVVGALLACAIAICSVLVAAPAASAAPAAGATRGAVTTNCSWGSCSIYVSRSATKELNARVGSWTSSAEKTSAGICGVLLVAGGVPGAVCGGGALLAAGNMELAKEQIKEAAETHGPRGACFKMTKAHASTFIYYSTNNGTFCKN